MEILISFILKAVDNGLSTAKTIYLNKEKYTVISGYASQDKNFG